MPIFEYICQSCKHRFESLVMGAAEPSCPSCRSTELQKQWSTFGVGATSDWSSSTSAGPCGSCGDPRGPGSCSIN